MSLELFVLLVLTGFAIGISLVLTIVRSLNPAIRYPAHPELVPVASSGIGGWITVLALLATGYFLFQSKCARDIQSWIPIPDGKKETPNQKPNSTQVIFETLGSQEQQNEPNEESPNQPQPQKRGGAEIYDPNYAPAGESEPNEIPVLTSTLPYSESNNAHYYLQIFASGKRKVAKNQQEQWANRTGYYILLGTVPSESPAQYRVLIGPFDSAAETKTFQRKHNIEGFIQSGDTLTIL